MVLLVAAVAFVASCFLAGLVHKGVLNSAVVGSRHRLLLQAPAGLYVASGSLVGRRGFDGLHLRRLRYRAGADGRRTTLAADQPNGASLAPPATGPAALLLPEINETSSDPCASVLGQPKAALLFLTKLPQLYHSEAWQSWFEAAAGKVVARQVVNRSCTQPGAGAKERLLAAVQRVAIKRACGQEDGASVLSRQHLFTVYIHAPPGSSEAALHQLWRGHLAAHRQATEWGTHSLVAATRQMLWEAFADPLNQR